MILCKRFRFDFSKEITEMLSEFSTIHHHEKRKVFQESWNSWILKDDVKKVLEKECGSLKEQGFEGDIYDKMYKSARYYHKKRDIEKNKERKQIVHTNRFSSQFLRIIDDVIENQIQREIKSQKGEIKKSQVEFFKEFCLITKDDILTELKSIKREKGEISNEIGEKLKKTYKNRFYKNRINVVKD